MTINEKKQLSNYIKGLVRESINQLNENNFRGCKSIEIKWHGEWADPELKFNGHLANYYEIENALVEMAKEEGINPENDDEFNKFCQEHEQDIQEMIVNGGEKEEHPFDNNEGGDIAGLNEIRNLLESITREELRKHLNEKKGRKKSKKQASSKEKSVVSQLNADGTNAAAYFYKLYGVENGTDAEKAAARSKGYKKAKGKKNDSGVPYRFSTRERNRLASLLTDKS